jgi:hypothetical protein
LVKIFQYVVKKNPGEKKKKKSLGRTDPLIAPIGRNVNKNMPLFLSLLIRN